MHLRLQASYKVDSVMKLNMYNLYKYPTTRSYAP